MITLENLRQYCLQKPFTTEELPFDDIVLVYKVQGKIFALTSQDDWARVNLKCDPEIALERRSEYEGVEPAFHMNKKHWLTVPLDGSVPSNVVLSWIDDSYMLVVSGLTKAKRLEVLSAVNSFGAETPKSWQNP